MTAAQAISYISLGLNAQSNARAFTRSNRATITASVSV
ncbi:hypothetical protein GPUN_0880 [Glaciecola punicea ACAM 611]|uniref:Uncharacterized protein n=1 Tax=Glaciecola punicea ACAM 611 TaxID=1121923 RepID=H5T9N5_9ALTE|nr:hypothetical protein GPUN_0880 [Glaciecola punicea ACAM 611]